MILSLILAQAAEALDRFESIWLLVAAAFPFVYPFVVKAGAQKWFKLVLSVGLSLVVAFLTLLPQLDGQDLTVGLFLEWGAMFVGVVQVVYQAADVAIETLAYDRAGGLNAAPVYRPHRGFGREETVGPDSIDRAA